MSQTNKKERLTIDVSMDENLIPEKFQFMILGNKPATKVTMQLGEDKLESVNVVKLLGVHIDSNLNFSEQIKDC